MPDANDSRSRLEGIPLYQLIVALYCLVAAAGIAALAGQGRLPGHDLTQIAPFVAHLLLNGLALALASHFQDASAPSARLAITRVGAFLLAYGMGITGLFLAGQAAIGLNPCNAPALLLIVPGLAAFLESFRARGEEKHAGTEILDDPPRFPIKDILSGFGGSVLKQTIGWAALLGGLGAGLAWYTVLKNVLWSGARYSFPSLPQNVLTRTVEAWPLALIFLFLGLVTAASTWAPLLRQVFDQIKERLGFAVLTPEQRAVVQAHLQALWDYANAPEREKYSLAGLLVPAIPALTLVAGTFWLLANSDAISARLFPISYAGEGWGLVTRDSSALVWPMMLLFPAAWGLYRLATDFWPAALRQALILPLHKGPALEASTILALRRALSHELRDKKNQMDFDPLHFLLARRIRRSRILFTVSTICFVLALLIGWRGLASYTLVTDTRFEHVDFFTGRHQIHGYGDVASVHPECFLGRKPDVKYRVQFKDQQWVDLLREKDLPANLAALNRIDEKLRRSGARFEPATHNPRGLRNTRACIATLASEHGDPKGFARLLHAD